MRSVAMAQSRQIQRAGSARRRAALALTLTGRPDERDPAVDQFLHFASTAQLCVDELWVAEQDGVLLASVLIVPSAGRTAMLFASPGHERQHLQVTCELVREAVTGQDRQKIRLIQALLEPSQQLERQALTGAGFTALAQLLYMRSTGTSQGAPMALAPSIQVLNWHRHRRDLFAEAILASYAQTLDCPALVGLRDIDDILAGHMATGTFVPKLWFALWSDGDPVGVMLLNPVPPQRALELVYLGLSPGRRRRGLGRQLLRHALWLARRYEAGRIVLAVDRQNVPALELYRSLGFHQTARKNAMILALR